MAAVDAGTYLDPKRGMIKLSEWREMWRQGRNVEGNTMRSDDSLWNAQVKPKWGNSPLRSIRHQAVQNWAVELEKSGLASDTVKACVWLLGRILAAAKRDQRIQVNPCEDITYNPDRGRPSAPEHPPTAEQVDLIASHIRGAGNGRDRLDIYSRIPRIIKETGLRWEEAAGLLPDCVDLDTGWLEVRRVLEEVGGKVALRDYPKSDAGFRMLPLSRLARQLFAEHYELQPPIAGEAVFRALRGGFLYRANYYGKIWQPATVAAGVHLQVKLPTGKHDHWPTIHSLRHLYATRLENAGVPMSIIKLVCGHAKPKKRDVTWLYIHAPEDPAVYGPIVLAALEGEAHGPVAHALRLAG